MRIISGSHKGRRFSPPKNLPVRPTTDFAKEGLFNVIRNQKDIDGCSILDLCAGTGSVSFEFASRGASSVLSADSHYGCVKFINQQARNFEFNSIRAIKTDLFPFVKKLNQSFDIVFADPPYELEKVETIPNLLLSSNCLKEGGLLIFEHSRNFEFSEHERFLFSKKYGNVNFTFFA